MTDPSDKNRQAPDKVLGVFQRALNTHGYGFQYSVIKEVERLYQGHSYAWTLEQPEFPVEVRGHDTRIDIVLRRTPPPNSASSSPEQYILAECKRTNPAFSDWCFIRAPYVGRATNNRYVSMDKAQLVDEKVVTIASAKQYMEGSAYHIAIEVKSKGEGDPCGSVKGAIEDAVTQVLRGLNGMLEYVAKNCNVFPTSQHMLFLPVIFTTAHLWVSDADLSMASLETGNIDLTGSDFKEVNWLLYEYNMSPGLKHTLTLGGTDGTQPTLSKAVDTLNVRTIPVVGPAGIADFLGWAHYLELRP